MAATAFAASPLAGVKLATRSAVATRRTSRAAPVRAAADTATATASIGETFAALKKRNQCAFVPFICAGDPNLDATEKALAILDEAGADVIELGVPYSDPLADGPTIQVRPRASKLLNDARRKRARGASPSRTPSSVARERFAGRTTLSTSDSHLGGPVRRRTRFRGATKTSLLEKPAAIFLRRRPPRTLTICLSRLSVTAYKPFSKHISRRLPRRALWRAARRYRR
jgi:hypothetical protein